MKSGRARWLLLSILAAGASALAAAAYLRDKPVQAWYDAATDHIQGNYRILGGLNSICYTPTAELLEKRYGVKTEYIDSYIYMELDNYNQAYNSVSRPLLRLRFGKDIFTECYMEACPESRWGLEGAGKHGK